MRKLIIVAVGVCLLIAGIVAAKQLGSTNGQTGDKEVPEQSESMSDKTAQEIAAVMNRIDSARALLLTGRYELSDAITNVSIESEPFTMAKADGAIYLQVGYTEQIFKGGNTAFVDNNEHRILVATTREQQEQPVFKGFESLKHFVEDVEGKVSEKLIGGDKHVTIQGDSLTNYGTGSIAYDERTLRLKSSSTVMDVLMPGTDENKRVMLKLTIDTYCDLGCGGTAKMLTDKVIFDKKRVIVADSLKSYQLNKD